MDSINRNQSEGNHADLTGMSAVQRIKDVIKQTASCFFCTEHGYGPSAGSRPMAVQDVGDDGSLWFLSATDSYKNAEIAKSPKVQLFFQGTEHSGFLHLKGHAFINTDPDKIRDLWKPILKTWFTQGEYDPRITVIKVIPEDGYYWDNKHGNLIAGVKMLVGAAVGKTLDDSIEGRLAL